MGQEIAHSHFTDADFSRFSARLQSETALLHSWFRDDVFSSLDGIAGLELEAWLIDGAGRPAAINARLLEQLNDPLVVPELARFNIEINTCPVPLKSDALRRMLSGLEATYARCRRAAEQLDARLLTIGILPTLHEQDLTPGNMSDVKRYRALNEQVLRQREGRPLKLDIQGHEHLKIEHQTVMLESATTSFQIHLKVAPSRAAHYYNLAQILSAPMVALSANSPYLFGHDLWSETRIPLFEQAVAVGGFGAVAQGPIRRVSFGSGYVHTSLFECFQENLEHFPVLLPMCSDAAPKRLEHLRLHNGTIWRWNRPLIGFDNDGTPHLRIEHRVVPGGPTLIDSIANAACFFGLMQSLGTDTALSAPLLPFSTARDNFYAAARYGLDAQVHWGHEHKKPLQHLILDELLPLARRGLEQLTLDAADVDHFLGVIQARVETGQTGTAWQRAFVARYGLDWQGLTLAYREQQDSGAPVHTWRI
jgi:gamma-glutamyl:cysteine ligase YbdK (ATP-grasp superfamily)